MPDHVIVVGAGVIGCGIALELARAGYQVTVVDRGSAPGNGSTSASSAIVRYHYRHRDEAVVAWESGQRWMRWATYLGIEDPTGMARFINSGLLIFPGQLLDLTEALHHLHDLGIRVQTLTRAQAQARFPAVDPAQFGPPTLPSDPDFWADGQDAGDAYWMPECGYIDDPQLAAHNLAEAARALGVTFRFKCDVIAVLRNGRRVTGLTVAGGENVRAPIVVNAAGPWSRTLNEYAGVLDDFATSTTPLEQEIVSLPAPASFAADQGFCVTDADLGNYFRPSGTHSIVVGGMEAPCDRLEWLDQPEHARMNVSPSTWETQSLRVARRMPTLQIPTRPRGIVGVYDVTDDWIPIYDRTNLDGYYVAIGTSGHGFKQAPFVGKMMTDLIAACEAGHPHDRTPLQVLATWSHNTVNLGHFSRLRKVERQTAMG